MAGSDPKAGGRAAPPRMSAKFIEDGTGMVLSQCLYCDHLVRKTIPVCAAFPDGIPADVFTNRFDHRTPHDGDDAVLFTPREGVPGPALERLYRDLDLAGHGS